LASLRTLLLLVVIIVTNGSEPCHNHECHTSHWERIASVSPAVAARNRASERGTATPGLP
jgi:hypothetical protein